MYDVDFKFLKYNLIKAWHLAKIKNYEYGMKYVQKILEIKDEEQF